MRSGQISAHKEQAAVCFFRCTGVQPSCTKLLQILHDSCVQTRMRMKRGGHMRKGSLRLSMHGSFTPLVISATGGMGQAVAMAYKRMASLLAEKKGQPYCRAMGWLRCVLNFSLIHSAIQCTHGTRSARRRPGRLSLDSPIDLAAEESCCPATN